MKLKKSHIFLSVCIGIIITFAYSTYATGMEKNIADSVIRLHVIAHSDNEYDQSLKLKVRDAVINEVGELFADNVDISETRAEIIENMGNIKLAAEKEIHNNGYDYDVRIELGRSDFPTKVYGNVTLPAGTYEALKVIIGEGAGKNWWCVMFPPLCFVDAATAELPPESSELLKNSLTPEEYELITNSDSLPVQVKFKTFELWQNSKLKVKQIMAKK